jgi:hypothetical protein
MGQHVKKEQEKGNIHGKYEIKRSYKRKGKIIIFEGVDYGDGEKVSVSKGLDMVIYLQRTMTRGGKGGGYGRYKKKTVEAQQGNAAKLLHHVTPRHTGQQYRTLQDTWDLNDK